MAQTASNQYLAGLFDGEGCFSIARNRKLLSSGRLSESLFVTIRMGNTNRHLVELCREKWGCGSIKVRHTKPHHKPCYTWTAVGHSVFRVCEDLIPYLEAKREQAEIVLTLAEINRSRRGGGNKHPGMGNPLPPWRLWLGDVMIKRMHQLNKRGV